MFQQYLDLTVSNDDAINTTDIRVAFKKAYSHFLWVKNVLWLQEKNDL